MRHCCCSEHCCWDMLQLSCCRLDYPHHHHHPYSPYQCGALSANRDTERHSQSDRHKEKDKERTEQTKQATYLIFLSSSLPQFVAILLPKVGNCPSKCVENLSKERNKWQLLNLAKVNCWQQKVNNNNGSIIALTTVKAVSNPLPNCINSSTISSISVQWCNQGDNRALVRGLPFLLFSGKLLSWGLRASQPDCNQGIVFQQYSNITTTTITTDASIIRLEQWQKLKLKKSDWGKTKVRPDSLHNIIEHHQNWSTAAAK